MRAAWWWIDRWRKSTAYTDMTLAEMGAYRNLLDELWLRDGLLPDDDRILGKIAGSQEEWPLVRDAVLKHFVRENGGWRNPTHDEVSAWREAQAVKGRMRMAGIGWHERSALGKRAAAARWSETGKNASQASRDTSPNASRTASPVLPLPKVRTDPSRVAPKSAHARHRS